MHFELNPVESETLAQLCLQSLSAWSKVEVSELTHDRFIRRSILPHLQALSGRFNRQEAPELQEKYWQESSNPKHLRLAYGMVFHLSNAIRFYSVLRELEHWGILDPSSAEPQSWVDFGSGLGSVALAFQNWWMGSNPLRIAMIERERATLNAGIEGLEALQEITQKLDIRSFHRTIDLTKPLLPIGAPRFSGMTSSFWLNEFEQLTPVQVADSLNQLWDRHLLPEGLVILVEPALQKYSRRLLEVRKALIAKPTFVENYEILLPCMGAQTCGALLQPRDWCHETIRWWRPDYIKFIDDQLGQDHRELPFSYLVIRKLPKSGKRHVWKASHRLVSDIAHDAQDQLFYICGQDGKTKCRFKSDIELRRGSVLSGVKMRGDRDSTRIEQAKMVSPPKQRPTEKPSDAL